MSKLGCLYLNNLTSAAPSSRGRYVAWSRVIGSATERRACPRPHRWEIGRRRMNSNKAGVVITRTDAHSPSGSKSPLPF